MILKKQFNEVTVYFNIMSSSLKLEKDLILESILLSLIDFKFIKKNSDFNLQIKEQQKYFKHILVDFEPEDLDELKFIPKVIYNFLVETNQDHKFTIDYIEFPWYDDIIIINGLEILRKKLNVPTFSPSIRAEWNNPILVEKILNRY